MLIVVMLRGRHRGLPMAIDRAVLLPGQELMERLDRGDDGWGDREAGGGVEGEMRGGVGGEVVGKEEGDEGIGEEMGWV